MSQVSLGHPEFIPGMLPRHSDHQIPLCDFSFSVFQTSVDFNWGESKGCLIKRCLNSTEIPKVGIPKSGIPKPGIPRTGILKLGKTHTETLPETEISKARDSEVRHSENRDSESRDSEAGDSENGQIHGLLNSDTPQAPSDLRALFQIFPGNFPDFPRSSPDFPRNFQGPPKGQPLSLGSLTPSDDSEELL